MIVVKEVGNTLDRSMRSMAYTERIIDIDLCHIGKFFRKFLIVFRLAFFKTEVFKQEHFMVGKVICFFRCVLADHIVCKLDMAF